MAKQINIIDISNDYGAYIACSKDNEKEKFIICFCSNKFNLELTLAPEQLNLLMEEAIKSIKNKE